MSSITVFQENGLVTVFNAVIDGIEQLAVDARELHKFLKVKRDFSTWIKGRIKEYGFVLSLDFISLRQIGKLAPQNGGVKKKHGGHNKIEYHLTLDMAKELAMVENNEEGRKARRYFIKCERNSHMSTSEQRKVLVSACTKLSVGNKAISKVYAEVANQFGCEKPVDIPVDKLPKAIEYVYEQLLARQTTNEIDLNQIRLLTGKTFQINAWFNRMHPLLKAIGSELSYDVRDHVASANGVATYLNKKLDKPHDIKAIEQKMALRFE